jgi:hypothetical protein
VQNSNKVRLDWVVAAPGVALQATQPLSGEQPNPRWTKKETAGPPEGEPAESMGW